MGMSSSQARLLSITARLTDNEYRTQRLTNEKMKLSSISDNARLEYNMTLDAENLMFTAFDPSGNSSAVKLTPSVLYQYQPSKNQYALVNMAGKILVPGAEAQNYKKSQTLFDFLKCYDDTITTQEYKVMAENPQYSEYLGKLAVWESQKPDPSDSDYHNLWTETIVHSNNTLFTQFDSASATCFSQAVGGRAVCYLHVLAHMLDLDYGYYPHNYTTTTGGNVSIDYSKIEDSYIHGAGQTPNMRLVSDAIRDGYDFGYGNGKETLFAYDRASKDSESLKATLINNGLGHTISDVLWTLGPDAAKSGNETQKLLSSYKANGSLKTLKEKCIDLYYVIANEGADYNSVLKPMIYSFHDDLKNSSNEVIPHDDFLQDVYDAAVSAWESQKPEEVTRFIEVTKNRIVINDRDKSQWYTNLWYRMDGSKEPQAIVSNLAEGLYDETTLYYTLDNVSKRADADEEELNNYYSVLENSLATSSSWIRDVVAQGIVTMENVKAYSSASGKREYSWNSIIYTNAADISTEDDSSAISAAEAKYQMALEEVNVKDKRYQSMIRRLDTEHNALQTEYDSVKSAMEKNITRSYKSFSG